MIERVLLGLFTRCCRSETTLLKLMKLNTDENKNFLMRIQPKLLRFYRTFIVCQHLENENEFKLDKISDRRASVYGTCSTKDCGIPACSCSLEAKPKGKFSEMALSQKKQITQVFF